MVVCSLYLTSHMRGFWGSAGARSHFALATLFSLAYILTLLSYGQLLQRTYAPLKLTGFEQHGHMKALEHSTHNTAGARAKHRIP